MKPHVLSAILAAAEKTPERLIITDIDINYQSKTYTYAQMLHRVYGIAHMLEENSEPNDVIVIGHISSAEFIFALFACMLTNRIALPTLPPINRSSVTRLEHIVKLTKPKLFLAESQVIEKIKQITPLRYLFFDRIKQMVLKRLNLPSNIIDVVDDMGLCVATDSLMQENFPVQLNGDQIAYIQFTSGTIASPKGVMLSHENILDNSHGIQLHGGAIPDYHIYNWVPLQHDLGLIVVLSAINLGNQTTLMSPINFLKNPLFWLETISKLPTDYVCSSGPNFAYQMCNDLYDESKLSHLDLSKWRAAIMAGEPARVDILKTFVKNYYKHGFRETSLFIAYGCAECTVMASCTMEGTKPKVITVCREALSQNIISLDTIKKPIQLMSCGKPYLTVKVIDRESKNPVAERTIGEIIIAGKSLSAGYWQMPDETELKFINHNGTRYYHTGDLGFFYQGELYVTGRIKDIIIIDSRNYFPHEIEADLDVFADVIKPSKIIATTTDEAGTLGLAIIVEVRKSTPFDYHELVESIIKKINLNFGIPPKRVIIVRPNTVTNTTSGKKRRRHAYETIIKNRDVILYDYDTTQTPRVAQQRASIANQTHRRISIEQLSQTHIMETFISILNEVCQDNHTVSADTDLSTLPLDSVQIISTLNRLKHNLNIDFEMSHAVGQNITIAMLSANIHEQVKDKMTIIQSCHKNKRNTYHTAFSTCSDNTIFMFPFESDFNTDVVADKKHVINFASANYMSYANKPEILASIDAAVKNYGAAAVGSRFYGGNRTVFDALEQALAVITHQESALLFSSFHQAQSTIVNYLLEPDDCLFIDQQSHVIPLLPQQPVRHCCYDRYDLTSFITQLEQYSESNQKKIVYVDAINTTHGDIVALDKLIALKQHYDLFLILDESHSLGTLGHAGHGLLEHYHLQPSSVDLIIGQLDNTLASSGGFLSGDDYLITFLRYSAPCCIYENNLSPISAAAALSAIDLLKNDAKRISKLHDIACYTRQQLEHIALDIGQAQNTPIIPIFIRDTAKTLAFCQTLFHHGFYLHPVITPFVSSEDIGARIYLNADHEQSQIDYLVHTIRQSRCLR